MQYIIENNLGYVKPLECHLPEITITPQIANTSEENRVKFITYLRSLIRIKNLGKPLPEKIIYNTLLTEMGNPTNSGLTKSPGRLFEFIPVQLRYYQDCKDHKVLIQVRGKLNSEAGYAISMDKFRDDFLKFSHAHMIAPNEYILNTNLRTCLNGGIPYPYIPYNTIKDTSLFKAVEIYCPTFAVVRICEHTQLSKEFEYDKNLVEEDYWYSEKLTPEDIEHVLTLPTQDVPSFLKSKGINREIYSSGLYGWRKRRTILAGWDDKYSWRSLFLDKNASTDEHVNFTPKEISLVIKAIKSTLYPDRNT